MKVAEVTIGSCVDSVLACTITTSISGDLCATKELNQPTTRRNVYEFLVDAVKAKLYRTRWAVTHSLPMTSVLNAVVLRESFSLPIRGTEP